MKKLLLLFVFAFAACGTDRQEQAEVFAAQEINIDKTDVCENLDASVKESMDASDLRELCGIEAVCTDFEVELDCNGEWCVTYRTCRLEPTP